MTTYQFAPGRAMPKGTDANTIGLAIESIIQQHGEARPEILVERARDPESPLHPCFEWDDTEAARQHRLEQARYVLRAVVIVRADQPETSIRAFVNTERSGGWKAIDVVMSNPTDRELLLSQAKAELESFVRKYQSLEELSGVRKAIVEFTAAATAPVKATKAKRARVRHEEQKAA